MYHSVRLMWRWLSPICCQLEAMPKLMSLLLHLRSKLQQAGSEVKGVDSVLLAMASKLVAMVSKRDGLQANIFINEDH